MKKYSEFEMKISKMFFQDEKKEELLEYLGGRTEMFWDSINLIHTINMLAIPNEHAEYNIAKNEICNKYINNSVVCFRLLEEGMYDDFLTMLRQNIELATLLNYFVVNPEKIDKWLMGQLKEGRSSGSIRPKDRRESDTDLQDLLNQDYDELSTFTHTKSNSIGTSFPGGYFDPPLVDSYFFRLYFYMFQMIGYLVSKIEITLDIDVEKIIGESKLSEKIDESLIACIKEYKLTEGYVSELFEWTFE